MRVNMREAKANLSRLVAAALRGEEVILARAGKPCVRLVSVQPPPRQPGQAKDRAAITPAAFDPLPKAELQAWEGR